MKLPIHKGELSLTHNEHLSELPSPFGRGLLGNGS